MLWSQPSFLEVSSTAIEISKENQKVLQVVAKDFKSTPDEVLTNLLRGNDMNNTDDYERMKALTQGRERGPKKDMLDKMLEMKMIGMMGNMGGSGGGDGGAMNPKDAMTYGLLSRMMAPQQPVAPPPQQDPLMNMMMMKMIFNDGGSKGQMTPEMMMKLMELREPKTDNRDHIIEQMLEQRNQTEVGQELEAMRAQRESDRREMWEIYQSMWTAQQPGNQQQQPGYGTYEQGGDFDNLTLKDAFKVSGELEAAGITGPKTGAEHERKMQADVQRAKIEAEREATTKGFSMIKGALESTDRKVEMGLEAFISELREERTERRNRASAGLPPVAAQPPAAPYPQQPQYPAQPQGPAAPAQQMPAGYAGYTPEQYEQAVQYYTQVAAQKQQEQQQAAIQNQAPQVEPQVPLSGISDPFGALPTSSNPPAQPAQMPVQQAQAPVQQAQEQVQPQVQQPEAGMVEERLGVVEWTDKGYQCIRCGAFSTSINCSQCD